jgi:hypothetical protein
VRKWARRIGVTASLVLLVATLAAWARAQWASGEVRGWAVTGPEPPATASVVGLIACRSSLVLFVRRETFGALTGTASPDVEPGRPTTLGFTCETADAQPLRAIVRGGGSLGFGWRTYYRPMGPDRAWSVPDADGRYYPTASRGALVACPWAFLAACFAAAPLRAALRWRKARRRPPHACPGCGYDLRATADASGPRLPTCPECGRTTGDPAPARRARPPEPAAGPVTPRR